MAALLSGWHPAAFGGDFDALPLRSSVMYAPVPQWPTEADFHNAVNGEHHEEAAARWRIEAIRWRRSHPPTSHPAMGLKAIALACAASFYRAAMEES